MTRLNPYERVPAEQRDEIIEQCAKVCLDERVDAEATNEETDIVYNNAITCCVHAVRALKSKHSALQKPPNTVEQDAMVYQALGWFHADVCMMLDSGKDPRREAVPEMIERIKRDMPELFRSPPAREPEQ